MNSSLWQEILLVLVGSRRFFSLLLKNLCSQQMALHQPDCVMPFLQPSFLLYLQGDQGFGEKKCFFFTYTACTAAVCTVKVLKFMEHLYLYTGVFFLTRKIKYKLFSLLLLGRKSISLFGITVLKYFDLQQQHLRAVQVRTDTLHDWILICHVRGSNPFLLRDACICGHVTTTSSHCLDIAQHMRFPCCDRNSLNIDNPKGCTEKFVM